MRADALVISQARLIFSLDKWTPSVAHLSCRLSIQRRPNLIKWAWLISILVDLLFLNGTTGCCGRRRQLSTLERTHATTCQVVSGQIINDDDDEKKCLFLFLFIFQIGKNHHSWGKYGFSTSALSRLLTASIELALRWNASSTKRRRRIIIKRKNTSASQQE